MSVAPFKMRLGFGSAVCAFAALALPVATLAASSKPNDAKQNAEAVSEGQSLHKRQAHKYGHAVRTKHRKHRKHGNTGEANDAAQDDSSTFYDPDNDAEPSAALTRTATENARNVAREAAGAAAKDAVRNAAKENAKEQVRNAGH